jgi:hypothetical protein
VHWGQNNQVSVTIVITSDGRQRTLTEGRSQAKHAATLSVPTAGPGVPVERCGILACL